MKHLQLLFLVFFSSSFLYLNAQSKEYVKSIEASGIRGIQLSKTFPILKSGFQINAVIAKPVSPYFEVGIGAGYMQLENEYFTPLFIQLKGSKNGKANGIFFIGSIGTSKGVNNNFFNDVNTDFTGGIYIAPKLGYQYVINGNLMFYCSGNYTVQKAELHNLQNGNIVHTEPLTLDLFCITIGFNIY